MAGAEVFTSEWASGIFPPERADSFFEALFGGAEEGAYDISLRFVEKRDRVYEFAFDLKQRPGRCLACNLTYGLPQVFARHPVLNVAGVAVSAAEALGVNPSEVSWELKPTREVSSALHSIPFLMTVP